MASGRQELRARRKDNDMVNRRHSITYSETLPVSGADIPFEELLARELRKLDGNGSKTVVKTGNKTRTKSFLKKGARGWWMQQRDAEKKLVKHTLTSNNEIEIKTISMKQRRPQEQRDERALSFLLAEPFSSTPKKGRTIGNVSQTLSPSMSPIRRTQYNYQDKDEMQQPMVQNDNFTAWKNGSLRSTTSTDIMGMQNVRQSYEAHQEREANDMAVFEAIERDLAAEKQAFLMEKQQQEQDKPVEQREKIDRVNHSGANHCGLPYSSFVSDLHEQEEMRRQTTRRDSFFDSALVFDDYSALSKDDGIAEQDSSTCQVRQNFDYGKRCGDPLLDLSAISYDDSVPWDDGLSLQSRQSAAHKQSLIIAAAGLLVSPNKQDCLSGEGVRQQASKRGLCFAERNGDGHNAIGHNKSDHPDFIPGGNAPASLLVRHMFGEFEQGFSPYHEDDTNSIGDSTSIKTASRDPSPPPPPPVQERSLSNRAQKLRMQQQPPTTKTSTSKAKADDKRLRQAKVKTAASSRDFGTKSSNDTLTPSRDQLAQLSDAGMVLPAVIEEKLYELEAEVMFYKSETLQLQKRKSYYDQEVKKLALERDEFERFQQEQRLLIEKEWERERFRMKNEAKHQERQWKLRMNATISHQGRKDCGETEMLKAQTVKMQIDEKARPSKWKAGNDDVRQRVLQLEEKNRELADEIKFLKKDRFEQWEQYDRLLKTQQTFGLASKSGATSPVPSVLSEKNELRIMNDVFAINGTADELLQKWNYPRKSPPKTHDKNDTSARSAYENCVQSNAADSYNPKRCSYGRENLHPLTESGTLKGGNELGVLSVKDVDIASDADNVFASTAAATNEWTLPAVEKNVEVLANIGDQKAHNRDEDGTISASTSSLSEHKVVTQKIEHTGGKKELFYPDGSRKIVFPDGNEKDIDVNGHTVIKFTNGDQKEFFPDTGVRVYYYYEAQTKLTTYPDNRKVYAFPNQQIETSMPDGTTEIEFPDGIKKTIRQNGDEFSVFPDGTTMLEMLSGLREVTLLNQKKIRYFPDGQMTCVSLSGQETRIQSDSELKQLTYSN